MNLKVGQRASLSKIIREDDIELFAQVTGDVNPLHLDTEFAARSRFGQKVAHGLLTAGLISAVIGNKLPGPGTIYLNQTLNFRRPVFIGDKITAIVEVVSYDRGKGIAKLQTICTNHNDDEVLKGEAVVLVERGAE
jgi:3-hydroxybutyryl-CoA dehydratase